MARKSKTAKRSSVNKTLTGAGEPDFEALNNFMTPNYKSHFIDALNYANVALDNTKLAKISRQVLKDNYNIHIPASVPDWEFVSLGKLFWLESKNVILEDSMKKDMEQRANDLLKKYVANKEDKPVNKKTPTDIHTENLIADIDEILDDVVFSDKKIKYEQKTVDILTETILKYQELSMNFSSVKAYYEAQLNQLTDSEFDEYFEHRSSSEKKNLSKLLTVVLEGIDKLYTTKQKTRKPSKPRKKKKIDPSKMVAKLKYLDKDNDFDLKSIHPEKIVGAKILWLYNVKTKELSRYVSDKGFTVKGSKLCDYDEKESKSKRLRKPKVVLKELEKAGKVIEKKLLAKLTTKENTVNGRINNNMIILKVFK